MLIGLTGKAFAGKSTVGEYLRKVHLFQAKSFADPIRDGLKVMLGLRDADFSPLVKERTIEWIGKSPRQLMQTLGTEWGREQVCKGLWVTHMAKRIERVLKCGGDVVITDVRFCREAEMISRFGGQLWRIQRPGHGHTSLHSDHLSEQEGKRLIAEVHLINSGSEEELFEQVDAAYEEALEEEFERNSMRRWGDSG